MDQYAIRTDRFLLRLFYFFTSMVGVAVGVNFVFTANMGADPVNVFVQGMSKGVGLSIGTWITLLWLLFMGLAFVLGVKPYIATLLDLMFFGFFVDLSMAWIKLPEPTGYAHALLYLLIGLLFIGFFVGVYLNAQLGAGPTMLFVYALSDKTSKSIGFIKTLVDVVFLVIGILMGGTVGFGTVFLALTVGYCIEFFTKRTKLYGLT